jgi:hypothetical protein
MMTLQLLATISLHLTFNAIHFFGLLEKMIRFAISAALALLGATGSFAQTKLPTVDEALEISAKTGRPIFAMAGQKT